MSEPSNESIDNSPNPYAYLNRDDFTSEKFKIEVRGLPKFYGIKEFKKLLNEKLNLDICKIKPPKQGKGCGWAFVCFRSEDAREFAITTIDGFTWKNSKLTAKVCYKLQFNVNCNILNIIICYIESEASSRSIY